MNKIEQSSNSSEMSSDGLARMNKEGFILGKSGYGMKYFAEREMLKILETLKDTSDIIIIDPEEERQSE